MKRKLSELTDYEPEAGYDDPVTGSSGRLMIYRDEAPPKEEKPSSFSSSINNVLNQLFRPDEKRYQLWPEKIIREGLTAAGDVVSGKVPTMALDPVTGEVHTSPEMIEKAQAISALAGTGGLAGGAEGAALNATPSLRPALKHKERLYKGKPGQEHQDIIPKELYDDFSRKAMSGEDLAEYNFGFINDKGHFLNREDALKYGIDTGLIDPHSGRFGALTTTLMADSSKPGTAIEAMKVANPFFSAVEHTVKGIQQNKMNGEAWLGTLANKPGVKPEELEWTGLKSFLEENKGKPVTKQQIEEHIAANKVELKEVTKGTGELKAAAEELQAAIGDKPITLPGWRNSLYADEIEQGLWSHDLTPKDLPTNLQPYAEKMLSLRHQQENPTKYHSYQLPGGENYREMLLTLPNKEQRQYGFEWFDPATQKSRAYATEAEAKANAPAGAVVSKTEIGPTLNPAYKSSHWDEPNILAHVRMNDRNIDGKKSLHLEEIQSDWHQQGRDRGYKQGVQEIKGFKPEELKLEKGEYDWSGISPDGRSAKVGQGVAKTEQEARDYLTRHLNKLAAEQNSAARIAESDKLPDAPFKKTWHELALKRMLREAAEKGYDRLSWTPGEAQAARYSLEKQLKELQYLKNDDGTYSIAGVTKDGGGFNHPENVTADKLPNIVGKEMAEKIIKNEGKRARGHPANGGYFEGVDLKIGGEGMKGFYDQIIPKALEKLGKEHGVKVQKGEIDTGKRTKSGMSGKSNPIKEPIFYIDIPQSLKDTAIRKGFPLFSNAHPGYTFIPVEGDPFRENSK